MKNTPPVDLGQSPTLCSRFASIAGVRLHYVQDGQGEPVLLVPGWPQTSHAWRHVLPGLAERMTAIAVDPRGFGASDAPPDGYDLKTVAAELVAFMHLLGHRRFAVVGHDVGVWIGYAMAADHPDSVSCLAVVDAVIPGLIVSPPLFLPDEANAWMWHFAFNRLPDINELLVRGQERAFLNAQFQTKAHVAGAITPDALDVYVKAYEQPNTLRASFEYYRAISENIRQNEARARQRLSQPVLAVGAEHGTGTRIANMMQAVADDVQGVVIPGSGHYVPEEAPGRLQEWLLPFLTAE